MFRPDGQSRMDDTRGAMTFDARKPRQPGDPEPGDNEPRQIERAVSNLDSPSSVEIWKQLMGYYVHELDAQAENRQQMATDEDFYDSIHFTEEEIAVMENRGQTPMIFNVTKTTINWVLGTQRRAPKEYKILPRTKAGADAALRKGELMKHVADTNLAEYEVADAFAHAVKVGIGWLESARGSDEDGTKVIYRAEDWRAMLWDSTSRRYDLRDAKYIFRTKWLDTDVVNGMWPKRKGVVENSQQQAIYGRGEDSLGDDAMDSSEIAHFDLSTGVMRHNDLGATRTRVRVIEAWFKVTKPIKVMSGGQFAGESFDPWSEGHVNDINNGLASVVEATREAIHMAIFTDNGLLDLRRSPYRHNRYPFTPIWGYRRGRDGMPYGMIRDIRDPQRDLNRRMAKASHFLATTRVTVEDGAVDDIEDLRDEAARPDAVIVYNVGRAPPVIENNTNMAAAHVEIMDRDQSLIQSVGGVTDENLGRRTNATSGIAIERRQSQGALATSTFFENLRRSSMIHGEKVMVLIEMFYNKRDEFRITDMRGNPDFKTINDGTPEGAIASFKSDFIMDEDDWRASSRQAQAESLLELAGQLAQTAPELVVGILDLIVEVLDVPKRDEIVKRIRNLTGAEDPDADPNNPSPEMQAKKDAATKQQQMADRQMEVTIGTQEAQLRKMIADAKSAESGSQDAYIARLKAAFDAALSIAGAPAMANAADQILSDAMAAELDNGGQMPAPAMPDELQGMPEMPMEQQMPGQPMPTEQIDPAMMPPVQPTAM